MDTHKIRVPQGEKAKTTIELDRETLLSVDTGSGVFLCYLEPCSKHPKGALFIESRTDTRLRVVKLLLPSRKVVELLFVRREETCEKAS